MSPGPEQGVADKNQPDNHFKYSPEPVTAGKQTLRCGGAGQEPDADKPDQHPQQRTHTASKHNKLVEMTGVEPATP